MSETATCREILAPFCQEPLGMDVGYGGDRIVPHAWAFDLPTPYTHVGDERQQLRGSATKFSFLCDNALDWIYSSHLLEDFGYSDMIDILIEWRRVLKVGGLLITNCPDQQKYLAHCSATGQCANSSHKEADFSIENFEKIVLRLSGSWETVFRQPEHGAYSWLQVSRKI